MAVVVEALDGRFFDGAVHALDLPVGPGMPGLGGAMIDAGPAAGEFEGVGSEELSLLDGLPDLRSLRRLAW